MKSAGGETDRSRVGARTIRGCIARYKCIKNKDKRCAVDKGSFKDVRAQMIVPGSTYWNMGLGLDKGEVKEDAEGLNNMLNLGETIAWLGKVMKPHLDTFPDTKTTFE